MVHRHALAAALPAGERRTHGRERHREKHLSLIHIWIARKIAQDALEIRHRRAREDTGKVHSLKLSLIHIYLSAAETTGALDTDALGTGLAGGLNGLAHGATEGNAALKLLGDGLSHQRCV